MSKRMFYLNLKKMSQKTTVSSIEINLEDLIGDYLELSEVIIEFRNLKNRKNLASGKYVLNRRLEKHIDDFQKQLGKMNYRALQISNVLSNNEQELKN